MAYRSSDTMPSNLSDPFHGTLELKISGRRRVGILEFFLSGVSLGSETVPKNPWGALLILAEFAQNSSTALTYLSSSELALQLTNAGVFEDSDPQNAIRTIYRLRKKLGRFTIAEKLVSAGYLSAPTDFGMALVSRSNVLGYRISLPPEHLIMELDPDN